MTKEMTQRQMRVGNLLKQEIAQSLTQGSTSHIAVMPFVTVSEVWVSPDLRNARVYFTCLQKDVDVKELANLLNAEVAAPARKHLSGSLNLKYTPKLKFYYDETFDAADRLNGVFSKDPSAA